LRLSSRIITTSATPSEMVMETRSLMRGSLAGQDFSARSV
jgi:hypothetical protein